MLIPERLTEIYNVDIAFESGIDNGNAILYSSNDEYILESISAELEKLIESSNMLGTKYGVIEYLGEIKNDCGEAISLESELELDDNDDIIVLEFAPLVAEGFDINDSNVNLVISTPTPFNENSKVGIIIGLANEATGEFEKVYYTGFGNFEGNVEVTMSPEVLFAIQESFAYIMMVEKTE